MLFITSWAPRLPKHRPNDINVPLYYMEFTVRRVIENKAAGKYWIFTVRLVFITFNLVVLGNYPYWFIVSFIEKMRLKL